MGIRVPFSRRKRYLTGIDWTIGMFDHMLKRVSGAGNASQIVLHLDRSISEPDFRDSFHRFSERFPVLQGRVRRDWNLAPHWSIPARQKPHPFRLDVEHFAPDTRLDRLLATVTCRVNDRFLSETDHLAFSLASAGQSGCLLSMRFDHRLFDAQGAEAFLDLFHRFHSGQLPAPPETGISLTEPAHLSDWLQMFAAGQRVNRALLSLREASHPTFDYSSLTDLRTCFRFATFDVPTTRAIVEKAYRSAGYLMLLPYLLASGIEAFHRLFVRKGIDIPDYIVPASFDMRRPNTLPENLFFNHVSFIFFRVRTREIADRAALTASLRQQFYDCNKSGFLNDIVQATHPMRILPHGILAALTRLPFRGHFGSISFAQVSTSAYRSPAFMDATVLNLYHAPRVPVPPALGFFFNMYQGRLNLTISYLPGLLSEQDVESVIADLGNLT